MAISRTEYIQHYARRARERLSARAEELSEIFNMPLTEKAEIVLKNKLRSLAIVSLAISGFLLIVMLESPPFFIASIVMGIVGALFDFAVEYKGISFRDWDYPNRNLSFRTVPLELPVLFFSTGVASVYMVYAFTNPLAWRLFVPLVYGISAIQIVLIATGIIFLWRYFTHAVDSITFGLLPIAIALYLWYPSPWILVFSIFPIYLDYYIEKYMVSSAEITYDSYSFEKAFNVAISYFPSAIIMLSLAAMIVALLMGM